MSRILYNFLMYGEYEDGCEFYAGGFDEEDCMERLISRIKDHGALTYYTTVNNEDYYDGERIQ